jgi:predicted transcriptional regulator
MPLIWRLPDDLDEILQAQADIEERSIQLIAQDAVREYIDRRSFLLQVDDTLDVLIPRHQPTDNRLGDPRRD